jgi:hypothetical protein
MGLKGWGRLVLYQGDTDEACRLRKRMAAEVAADLSGSVDAGGAPASSFAADFPEEHAAMRSLADYDTGEVWRPE